MRRCVYRCGLYTALSLMVLALCGLAGISAPGTVGAAGSVSLVRHLGGRVSAVMATDNYVLWARGAELEVYSADGASRLGGLLLPELIVDLDVEGSTAFVAALDGLYLVDLTNLATPTLARHVAVPPLSDLAAVSAVEATATHAYVGLAEGGLWTIALAAPDAPAGVIPASQFVSKLAQAGDFLISLDTNTPSQPRVWSLTSPGVPTDLGLLDTREDVAGVAVAGNRLYLATSMEGLAIYDWSPAQPTAATLAGTLAVGFGAFDVTVAPDGQRALLLSDIGVVLVDVSNPAAPVQLDAQLAPAGFYSRVVAHGSRVFVAAREAGLHVYGYDGASLTFAHELGLRGSPLAGARHGGYVFIAADTQGLLKLGVGFPGNPALSGRVPTSGPAQSVTVSGSYVLVGDGSDVVALQASDWLEVGRLTLPDYNYVRGFALGANDTVYVAAGHAGVCVVRLAAGVPELQTCLNTDGEALDLAVDGTRLYVADSWNGVVVVDATNAHSLHSLGRYQSAQAMEVAVVGPQLYVSDVNNGNGRLLVLNRGLGAALNIATQFDTRGFVDDIELSGNLVYLANQEGLEVLRRAAPASLEPWAWYPSPGGAAGVLLNGGYVYLLDGANGLLVLTVTQPDGASTPTPHPGLGAFQVWVPFAPR